MPNRQATARNQRAQPQPPNRDARRHPDHLLWGMEEAANALNVSRKYMYDLVHSGELATVKLGRRRLIPDDELRRFIDSLTDEAAS